MVDSLVTMAFETLRDLLVEEVKLLPEVSHQVKQVERDLRTMHSFLIDADKWPNRKSNTLSNWICDLKYLASEAENVLEKYAVEVKFKRGGQNTKKKLKRFACILSECFSVHQIGKDTEAIRSRLTNLTERLRSMPRGEGSSDSSEDQQQLLRLKYAHEVEQHFVGMEKDIECLVSLVKDDDHRCNSPVISIYGMGGLGKTTLARKIYHHKDVQRCFEARAWVCVTQQFEAETVLREILKQVVMGGKEEINNMGQRELVVQLYNVLMQTKCLIVIDDIWEIDHWDILKAAFPTNCKVLLTTRKENIVSQESRYKLGFLTEDQGWELLQKIALPRDHSQVLETELRSLEVIGKQMVKKCGRLPLAISVIGGILRQKQTLLEWKNVNSNIDSYMKHGEGVGKDTRVNQVLDLSYHVLPYYLKPCFLYLGCFPEDEEINVERLYLLWMAEGLISSEDKGNKETLIDVAERHLIELAFRCMVQVQKDENFTAYTKFKSCRLHDLMHELCSSKAEEEKFLKRVDHYKNTYANPSISSRLAICDDGGSTSSINGIQEHEDLRSFLAVQKNRYFLPRSHFQNSIVNFEKSKYLKILILDGCEFEGGKLPSTVGKLIHLRYLSLFDSKVTKLPLSVCKLPYLQTLDLRVLDSIKLPNVVYKMKRLRHLFLSEINVIGGDKLKLDGLELDTLQGIKSNTARIADIPKLTNLRNLGVGVNDMDSLSIVVHHMTNNQSQLRETYLSIESCDFSSEEGANVFREILKCHSLVSLELKLYSDEHIID